jgi:glycosyltransferase involved in cell wall biosynthesis
MNNLTIGGVETVCWNIISNLNHDDYKVDLLVATDKEVKQYYEDKFIALGCCIYKGGYITDQKTKKEFLEYEKKLLRMNSYDIVHSHVDFLNAWTLKCAKKEKVKTRISHVHTGCTDKKNLMQSFKYRLQKILLVHYSTIRLGCSMDTVRYYYGNNKKAEVIYNGIEVNQYLKIADSIEKSDKNIITIGRICEAKNPDFILDIFDALYHIDPEYELYWIGDGNLCNYTKKRVKELGLSNNVHMIGATTLTIPYLKKCRITLFPSKWEGLPIALVECQLSHCFAFYSDVVTTEADIGYAISLSLSDTPSDWAKTIHEFNKNKEYIKYENDSRLIEQFSIENMITQMCKIYES